MQRNHLKHSTRMKTASLTARNSVPSLPKGAVVGDHVVQEMRHEKGIDRGPKAIGRRATVIAHPEKVTEALRAEGLKVAAPVDQTADRRALSTG